MKIYTGRGGMSLRQEALKDEFNKLPKRKGDRKLKSILPKRKMKARWESSLGLFVKDPTRMLKIVQNKFGN
jgi:hypothetical protein